MGSWGCPHEVDERCQRVNGAYCVPGMKGCVLYGKVVFPDGEERLPRWPGREAGRGRGVPTGGRREDV
jgi:hypothetical protein